MEFACFPVYMAALMNIPIQIKVILRLNALEVDVFYDKLLEWEKPIWA